MIGREQIIQSISTIPSLNEHAKRLIGRLYDASLSKQDLAESMRKDHRLVSGVLICSNLLLKRGQVVRAFDDLVDQADRDRLFEYLIVHTSLEWMRQESRTTRRSFLGLLSHGAAVGTIAVKLAEQLGAQRPPFLYACGFLHDIGKFIFEICLQIDSDGLIDRAEREGISLDEAERLTLSIDHAEIGALTLRQWALPNDIVQAVRYHHTPEQNPGDALMCDLVHTADAIALMMGYGPESEGLRYKTSPVVEHRRHLKVNIIEETVLRAQEELSSLEVVFTSLLEEY